MPAEFFMKYKLLLIGCLSLVFSCGNSSEENVLEPQSNSSMIFGEKNYRVPELSALAKEQAIQWGVLEDMLSQAQTINGSTHEDLLNHSERLQQYSDSLIKSVPQALDTDPIKSRLIVLNTRSRVLYQTSHQALIDSTDIQNAVTEMNAAVNNLIVQLNEKFQKEKIDLQRKGDEEMELQQQKRYKDSIMELELKDINRKNL